MKYRNRNHYELLQFRCWTPTHRVAVYCLCSSRINRSRGGTRCIFIAGRLVLQCHLPHPVYGGIEDEISHSPPQACEAPTRGTQNRGRFRRRGGETTVRHWREAPSLRDAGSAEIQLNTTELLEKNVHPQGSRDPGMTLGTAFIPKPVLLPLHPSTCQLRLSFFIKGAFIQFSVLPSSSCSAARVARSPTTPCNHICVSRQSTIQSGSSRPGSALRFHLLSTRRLVGSSQRSATPSDRHTTTRPRVSNGNRLLPST